MTDVRRFPSAAEVADNVALALLQQIVAAQAEGRVPHIGLTGGTIAETLHERLGDRGLFSGVDWTRVIFWWGDERFVAPDSEDRNARSARVDFLDVVGVPAEHVHEMPSTADVPSPEAGAAAYADEMRAHGSGSFDVLLLGLGPDGHVASLFPAHPALAVDDRIAVAIENSPKPPPARITLTLPALNRSREVWFLVAGAGKAPAVARALAADGSVEETPARGVTGELETRWWLDETAASAL